MVSKSAGGAPPVHNYVDCHQLRKPSRNIYINITFTNFQVNNALSQLDPLLYE